MILDAALYTPTQVPAPAVVLAHGFGGSRLDLEERAQRLADRGFVVLAYSARGFGASTGQISMNSPDYEIADARALIDYLATRSDVQQEDEGDPVVGIAGGSYGGALALLTAGYDSRVDALAADITWNDLESSLFGQSRVGEDQASAAIPGVFKDLWTGNFFGVGVVNRDGSVTECGRFTPALVPRLHGGRRRGNRDPGVTGADARIVAGQRHGSRHRTHTAHGGRGGLTVPARPGECERPADHVGEPGDAGQGGLARRRA